jgi:hypothetical protein
VSAGWVDLYARLCFAEARATSESDAEEDLGYGLTEDERNERKKWLRSQGETAIGVIP